MVPKATGVRRRVAQQPRVRLGTAAELRAASELLAGVAAQRVCGNVAARRGEERTNHESNNTMGNHGLYRRVGVGGLCLRLEDQPRLCLRSRVQWGHLPELVFEWRRVSFYRYLQYQKDISTVRSYATRCAARQASRT